MRKRIHRIFFDRCNFLRFGWMALICVTVAATAIAAVGVFIMVVFEKPRCSRVAEGLGTTKDFTLIAGCRLYLPDGRLIDEDKYRVVIPEAK